MGGRTRRRTLWDSLQAAVRGLQAAVRSQRTMRVHVGLAAGVAAVVIWLDLSAAETAVVVMTVVAVLSAELLNTAVEVVVDHLVGTRHDAVAGRAKDLSAAAVLVTAAGAAAVGLLVLAPPLAAGVGLAPLTASGAGRVAALVGMLVMALAALAGGREARVSRG